MKEGSKMFDLRRLRNPFKRLFVRMAKYRKKVNSFINRLNVRKVIGVAVLLIIVNMLGLYGLNHEQHRTYKEMVRVYELKEESRLNQLRATITFVNQGEWGYFLEEEAKRLLDDYQNNRLIYEEVRDQLVWIRNLSPLPRRISSYQNQVYRLKISKALFEEGIYHAKVKEWGLAKTKLSKVIKEDLNYEKAQYWLEEVERWEREEETMRSFKFYESQRFVHAY